MPRRLLGAGGAVLAWLLVAGCDTGKNPTTFARPDVSSTQVKTAPEPEKPVGPPALATEPPGPSPAPALTLSPRVFTITADDPGLQLLLTQRNTDGTVRDLSSRASWKCSPAGRASIDKGGYLVPRGAGEVEVTAEAGGASAQAHVVIEPRAQRPWDFASDIVPVLTRLGCNTGGCHGKADGQNGFRLSFLGYDPEGDFQAITRDAGRRRIDLLDPEQSLLLGKATGRIPHAGGMRMAPGTPEYGLLVEWLRAGAPRQMGKTHGKLVRVSVEPEAARLSEPGPQQIRVSAEFADGHLRDVTRMAVYKVNDDASASVTASGQGGLLRRSETDLVVNYQSKVVTSRLATEINPGLAFDFSKLPRRNFIDEELFKRLESLRVPPSPPAPDAAFLRRVSLDLTGELPTPDQIRRFLADPDPEKRTKLVDRLLGSQEFWLFWRIKLGDLLQISPARQGNSSYRYQQWVDDCLSKNTPWDVMVLQLLTALGDPNDPKTGGPVNYALDPPEPTVQAEQTAQRFLGLRMRCAQCHNHPFDVWTQDDYFGLAAFFAKVQRGGSPGMMMARAGVSINPEGQVIHLRTGKPAVPRLPGGEPVAVEPKADPRQALARWLVSPENPYFSRAAVNWAWAQLFGKGLVEPADDLSRANPPVHPALLDRLAQHFASKKFDLRDLVRTIATSEAYGLSSGTVPGNEQDQRLFSRHLPRPLTAHQMADALAQATDVPNRFPGAHATRRAIQVADPTVASTILDTFGRCPRTAGCAPVQTPPLSLKQSLLLIGGDVIESKVTHLNGYLDSALKLELEPEELVENLYLRTFCRMPTPEESSRWSAELKQATSPREAAEDLFWSLLNSREFVFNH
jgi:hypothetical protein